MSIKWAKEYLRFVIPVVYAIIGVIRVFAFVRHLILRVVVFVILFIPAVFYLIKQELGLDHPISLYRREYIALFSLDVAISQHFFILSGYFVAAVCIAYVGSLFGSFSTLEALQPWVTITTVGEGLTGVITSIILGVYGAVGVGLVASLIISTHSRVLSQIPRSTSDLVEHLSDNLEQGGEIGSEDVRIGEIALDLDVDLESNGIDEDTTLDDALDQLGLNFAEAIDKDEIKESLVDSEFDGDMWNTLAKRKLDSQDESELTDRIRTIIGENLDDLVKSGYLGSPTYEKVWTFLRTRDPWAQGHPIFAPKFELELDIEENTSE